MVNNYVFNLILQNLPELVNSTLITLTKWSSAMAAKETWSSANVSFEQNQGYFKENDLYSNISAFRFHIIIRF